MQNSLISFSLLLDFFSCSISFREKLMFRNQFVNKSVLFLRRKNAPSFFIVGKLTVLFLLWEGEA